MLRAHDKCVNLTDPDNGESLEPECYKWFYNNYDILVQFYKWAMDGLAWDIMEPSKVCVYYQNCDCDVNPDGCEVIGFNRTKTIPPGGPMFSWMF